MAGTAGCRPPTLRHRPTENRHQGGAVGALSRRAPATSVGRVCRAVALERVRGGGAGVGPPGGCPPGQDAGCGLFEPPSFGLLAPVVVPAERRVDAFADPHMSWKNSASLPNTYCCAPCLRRRPGTF